MENQLVVTNLATVSRKKSQNIGNLRVPFKERLAKELPLMSRRTIVSNFATRTRNDGYHFEDTDGESKGYQTDFTLDQGEEYKARFSHLRPPVTERKMGRFLHNPNEKVMSKSCEKIMEYIKPFHENVNKISTNREMDPSKSVRRILRSSGFLFGKLIPKVKMKPEFDDGYPIFTRDSTNTSQGYIDDDFLDEGIPEVENQDWQSRSFEPQNHEDFNFQPSQKENEEFTEVVSSDDFLVGSLFGPNKNSEDKENLNLGEQASHFPDRKQEANDFESIEPDMPQDTESYTGNYQASGCSEPKETYNTYFIEEELRFEFTSTKKVGNHSFVNLFRTIDNESSGGMISSSTALKMFGSENYNVVDEYSSSDDNSNKYSDTETVFTHSDDFGFNQTEIGSDSHDAYLPP